MNIPAPGANAGRLSNLVTAAEKRARQAKKNFESKRAALETAEKESPDKITRLDLEAAVKIARLQYKIKRVELKLAKGKLKATVKEEKINAETEQKRPAPTKDGKKAPKDSVAPAKARKNRKEITK